MSHPFTFRDGTWDAEIFRSVVEGNEYGLPDRFRPDDIILDIGTHIGSFCYAAASRGAGKVYGFEPNAANYVEACRNLNGFRDRVLIRHKAVWRSDRPAETLAFTANPDNTGGGHVLLNESSQAVDAIAFDDLVREVTLGGRRRIRLIKMDCEGSEFPILLTSKMLHLVDEIVGEYHEYGRRGGDQFIPEVARVAGYPRFTYDVLVEALRRGGLYITDLKDHPDPDTPTGVFRARRLAYPAIKGPLRTGLKAIRNSFRRVRQAS